MFKQKKTPKTSSTGERGPLVYEFHGSAYYMRWLPQDFDVDGDHIVGHLGRVTPQQVKAREPGVLGPMAGVPVGRDYLEVTTPPHLVLANLPTFDARGNPNMGSEDGLSLDTSAVRKFVAEYGLLHSRYLPNPNAIPKDGPIESFREPISDFAHAPRLLRLTWTEQFSPAYTAIFEELQEGFLSIANDLVFWGVIDRNFHLEAKDLWKYICFLFAYDLQTGSLGVCANPGCPAPYFRKGRRTQKYCEAGPCVGFAQQKYALQWWNAKGKYRRAKRMKKRNRSKTK